MKTGKKTNLWRITGLLTAAVCFAGITLSAYAASGETPAAGQGFDRAEAFSRSGQSGGSDESERLDFIPYIQNTYYEHPYVVEIGWNIPPQHQEEYPVSRTIRISPEVSLVCYFSPETEKYAEKSDFEEAFTGIYPVLEKEGERANIKVETPFIVSVEDVTGKTPAQLAADYYSEGKQACFAAVYPHLKPAEQEEYLDKIYAEKKISFFGAVAGRTDKTLIAQTAAKAAADSRVNFFSVALPWLDDTAVSEYARQFYKEGDIALFSVTVPFLCEEDREAFLLQAEKDKRIAFTGVLKKYVS